VTWLPISKFLVGIDYGIAYVFDDFEVLWIEKWFWKYKDN